MVKVSIIIPLHNSEAFIKETIQSCLNQSYQNIEVIVVENGSTDHSFEIVQGIRDMRIRLYKIEKANASAARNFGLQKAKGEYIQFLDADDLMSQNKIAFQIEALEKKPNGWLASCPWAKFTNSIHNSKIYPQKVWFIEDPLGWCVSALKGGGMMMICSWLIPKNVIDQAGPWDEKLSLHDDGEFMCRVLLASNGNCYVENAIVYYREVNDSLSRQNTSIKAAKSALAVCQSYKNQLLKRQSDDMVRFALAYSYRQFIYEFYERYPDLCREAQQELKELKIKPLPLVGGKYFRKIAKWIGFNNALFLRSLAKKI